jgi:hypothetical protein
MFLSTSGIHFVDKNMRYLKELDALSDSIESAIASAMALGMGSRA